MTDVALKTVLAEQLPQLISVTERMNGERTGETIFRWCDQLPKTAPEVTEREWDWIVRQVVGQLTPEQFLLFVKNLKSDNKSKSLEPRNAQFLTWQQRAISCLGVMGKL